MVLPTSGVLVLAYGLGTVAPIDLMLSTSLSLYAILKNSLEVCPMVSVAFEILFLTPIARVIIAYYHIALAAIWANI